jgi:hypothetical protein
VVSIEKKQWICFSSSRQEWYQIVRSGEKLVANSGIAKRHARCHGAGIGCETRQDQQEVMQEEEKTGEQERERETQKTKRKKRKPWINAATSKKRNQQRKNRANNRGEK